MRRLLMNNAAPSHIIINVVTRLVQYQLIILFAYFATIVVSGMWRETNCHEIKMASFLIFRIPDGCGYTSPLLFLPVFFEKPKNVSPLLFPPGIDAYSLQCIYGIATSRLRLCGSFLIRKETSEQIYALAQFYIFIYSSFEIGQTPRL